MSPIISDTNEVVIDGYLDPTSRESLTISGNLIKEWGAHTLLVGAEIIDTDNKNYRYNTNWSATSDDQATFAVTQPMTFTMTSASDPVAAIQQPASILPPVSTTARKPTLRLRRFIFRIRLISPII